MTTIAWDGKTLAADTQATSNGLRDNHAVKAWRHGRILIACCGLAALAQRFRSWVLDGMDGESPYDGAEDGNGLVITADHVLCYGTSGVWPVSQPFYTLGTGYQLAMGALAMGASAEEAVRVAAQFDTMTGGAVTVLSLQ